MTNEQLVQRTMNLLKEDLPEQEFTAKLDAIEKQSQEWTAEEYGSYREQARASDSNVAIVVSIIGCALFLLFGIAGGHMYMLQP